MAAAPLLVLAGKRDEQAPWRMSRVLFDADASAPEAKQLIVLDDAGHMDLLDWPEAIFGYRRLLALLPAS